MALCMGCMREIGDNVICPSCRFDNSNEQHSPFLPYGTVLHGRYIVGSVIDTNGESSRYIAFDKQTGDVVIVCEFLPMGLFERENDETNLTVRFENDEVFRKLTQDFISYFRTIAEPRLSGISQDRSLCPLSLLSRLFTAEVSVITPFLPRICT